MQPASSIVLQVLTQGLETGVGKVGFECEAEGFNGMFAWYHRLQVDPRLAPRQGSALEARQQPGHDHTRLAGATGSDDGQEPSCLRFAGHDPCHVLDQFVDQALTPKEIACIVCREGMQPLIWIAWCSGFFLFSCT